MSDQSSSKQPVKAPLAIDFLVIGGGVTGLATAIALTRVGHRVVLLEKGDGKTNTGSYGFHMPPNMSKILFHWGLRDELKKRGLVSHTMLLTRYDTGELLGTQIWDNHVITESRGDVMVLPHRDLYDLMHKTAIDAGATIRHGVDVVDVDGVKGKVKLASGEELSGDVLIGADGPYGVGRRTVMGTKDPGNPIGISMYATTLPREFVSSELLSKEDDHVVFVAFGSKRFVIGYPIGGGRFSLHYYTHDKAQYGEYGDPPSGDLSSLMVQCEPRLAEMAKHADPAVRIPIREYTNVENWVHKDGRMVIIGQAAHPFPPGSIQRGAMGVEDAAVLGKLFSHLSSKSQIPTFLWALQNLRRSRVQHLRIGAMKNVLFSLLEDGDAQKARDQAMRVKYRAGAPALDKLENSPEWDELRRTFGYDCEDEADNWWAKWGQMQIRGDRDSPITIQGTSAGHQNTGL